MLYKLVRLDGTILKLNIEIEPEMNDRLASLKIGGSVVTCKYLGNQTFAEQEDLSIPRSEWLSMAGVVAIVGLFGWVFFAMVSANSNVRPSAAVAMAAAPISATQSISISSSEYSIMSACDVRDAQLYRVRDTSGKQIAVICGGNAIQFPWQPQKGFTLRYTD